MKRIAVSPRENWQQEVEKVGLTYHHTTTQDGKSLVYWDESAYYSFQSFEIDEIEQSTSDLHALCIEAAQYVIDKNRFADLAIPASVVPLIKETWNSEPPSLYGRFDLAYDGKSPPKLLEYNADTPTALLEASVVQWYWLQDLFPTKDQFNSIHEQLIEKWRDIKPHIQQPLYFGSAQNPDTEDEMTVHYLRDTASQAGISTEFILMNDIGWDRSGNCFIDLDYKQIHSVFKLYPWEWIINEDFGKHVLDTYRKLVWIEPIWKMLWANKGILAILWELFPGHPNLVEANIGYEFSLPYYVRKPLLGREGSSVFMKTPYGAIEQPGEYGAGGYVYQEFIDVPDFDGHFPVVGSWLVDGTPTGIGIRESDSRITTNLSRFVPHLIE